MQTIEMHGNYTKNDRINLRLDGFTKGLLEQAATLDHRSLTGFILECAKAKAEEILDKKNTIYLNKKEWDNFIAVISTKDKPNKALVKAAKNYKKSNIKSDD